MRLSLHGTSDEKRVCNWQDIAKFWITWQMQFNVVVNIRKSLKKTGSRNVLSFLWLPRTCNGLTMTFFQLCGFFCRMQFVPTWSSDWLSLSILSPEHSFHLQCTHKKANPGWLYNQKPNVHQLHNALQCNAIVKKICMRISKAGLSNHGVKCSLENLANLYLNFSPPGLILAGKFLCFSICHKI